MSVTKVRGTKEVPKYVIDLVHKRTKAAQKLRETGIAVDEYCSSIGLDEFHPLFNDACLVTDVRIWCEEDHSESNTLEAIKKVLNGETE